MGSSAGGGDGSVRAERAKVTTRAETASTQPVRAKAQRAPKAVSRAPPVSGPNGWTMEDRNPAALWTRPTFSSGVTTRSFERNPMLATVDRHMVSAHMTPATTGRLTQAITPAAATQVQQVATIRTRECRAGLIRGASSAPDSAPAETQVRTKPPPTPDVPPSENAVRAVKVSAPNAKFMPSPNTRRTVRR